MGTGPSLNSTNLDLLDGEIVFGTNSCYNLPHVDFTYFCVVDLCVAQNHSGQLLKFLDEHEDLIAFVHPRVGEVAIKNHGRMSRMFPIDMDWDKGKWGDLECIPCTGRTVVIFALQVAYYMGFEEVYLLGCDCSYGKDPSQHHFDGSPVDNYLREDWSCIYDEYRNALNRYRQKGKKIINCTVGGNLEVFSRMPLEEVCFS